MSRETAAFLWRIWKNRRLNRAVERHFEDAQDLLAVQETLRGHRKAFDDVVRRYTPLLYSLSYRLLGSREEAEEAVQEIFLRAYHGVRQFRLGKRFYPWLYTIALNYLRSQLRKRYRRLGLGTRSLEEATDLPALPRPGENPGESVECAEVERLAQQALLGLPPRYREVFVLRQIEGLPVRDVAEILNLPEGTVKTFLHRGRALLIARLAEEGVTGNGR
jgi:RNA polymerase sigma-70 factor (ECF subfamily)